MSSPSGPGTPSRRSTRNAPSNPGTPTSVTSSRQSSRRGGKNSQEENMDTSDHDMSDLARPLPPSSPIKSPTSVSTVSSAKKSKKDGAAPFVDNQPFGGPGSVGPASNYGGPGSVLVSEIDLSSPLNYGTPSSLGSSTFRTPSGHLGVRGTPIRIRSDIQSERRLRQVNVAASPAPATPEPRSSRAQPSGPAVPPSDDSFVAGSEVSADVNPQLVIWGTDVSVAACKAKFKKFLETFIDPDVEEDEKLDGFNPTEPLYLQKLEQVITFYSFIHLA